MIYKEYKDKKIAKYVQWAKIWNWVPLIISFLSLLGLISSAIVQKNNSIFNMLWFFGITLITPIMMNRTLKWNKNPKGNVGLIISFVLWGIMFFVHLFFAFGTSLYWWGIIVFIILICGYGVIDNADKEAKIETETENNEKILLASFLGGFFWFDIVFFFVGLIGAIIYLFSDFGAGLGILLVSFLVMGPLCIEGIYILLAYVHIRKENRAIPPDYRVKDMEIKQYNAEQKQIKMQQEDLLKREERQRKLLSVVGKRFFIKYYCQLKYWSSADVFDIISENYSEESKNTRITNAKKIFGEQLQMLALKNITESREDIDEETQARAKELLKKEEQQIHDDNKPKCGDSRRSSDCNESEVKRLNRLLDSGAISQEEYHSEIMKLFDE